MQVLAGCGAGASQVRSPLCFGLYTTPPITCFMHSRYLGIVYQSAGDREDPSSSSRRDRGYVSPVALVHLIPSPFEYI